MHGAIYQQRGFLASSSTEIKNDIEIKVLLEALLKQQKLSIIHCPGHQKGETFTARRNNFADKMGKKVATKDLDKVKVQQIKTKKGGDKLLG